MSTYMTEEEQIEQIKRWWNKHGNTISTIALGLALCFAGYKYWNWHQDKLATQASVLYEQLIVAYTNQDNPGIASRANKLVQSHQGTAYADAAHLTLAKLAIENHAYPKAIKHLAQVVETNNNPALTQVAKLRLARVLLADKNYRDALAAIATVTDKSYLSLVNELRGDIYTAMGQLAEAKQAYDEAVVTTRQQNVGNLFLEMKTNDVARQKLSEQVSIKTA